MTEDTNAHTDAHGKRPFVAHTLRIFALPIIVFWVALTVLSLIHI